MSREVIAADGKHYRLHPTRPHIVQVQDKPGDHYRTHIIFFDRNGYTPAVDRAAAELASIGRLTEEVSE